MIRATARGEEEGGALCYAPSAASSLTQALAELMLEVIEDYHI